jgi:hypothetical protein
VCEIRPDHVARTPVFLRAPSADARVHLRFNLAHRFIEGGFHRRHDSLVPADCVEEGNALGNIESQVVSGPPVGDRARRQPLSVRPEVFQHSAKVLFLNRSVETEHPGGLATP